MATDISRACFTVMLMFVTTTWVEAAFATTVITYACFYGGFGQMVAGVFEVSTISSIIHTLKQ